jgi:predicted amidohydrolase
MAEIETREDLTMKIAVAQIDCTPGDIKSNCAKIPEYAELAKEKGCDTVIFPELVDTGYDVMKIGEIACYWELDQDDAPISIARDAARKTGINLMCGLSEQVGDAVYNSTAVFDPEGVLIGKYRKTHLADYPLFNEGNYVRPGDTLESVGVGDMKWGLMICYELRFPELSRSLVVNGAEVLALSSAWPFPRLIHWQTLIRARAIENQSYFIAANRVGTDIDITFCGSSRIVDPYGIVVAEAAEDREEMIVGEISKDLIQSVREYIPILTQRREDLY